MTSFRFRTNGPGERPVTLLAYSLGSRLVHQALLKLAEKRAFNIVENVIFIGSPLPAQNSTSWRAIRSVVSGRVVNCYAQDDWVLGFVYRGGSLEWGVAGLEEVNCIPGVENYDVSSFVSGHLQYVTVDFSADIDIGLRSVRSSNRWECMGWIRRPLQFAQRKGKLKRKRLKNRKRDINDEKLIADLKKTHIEEKQDT